MTLHIEPKIETLQLQTWSINAFCEILERSQMWASAREIPFASILVFAFVRVKTHCTNWLMNSEPCATCVNNFHISKENVIEQNLVSDPKIKNKIWLLHQIELT